MSVNGAYMFDIHSTSYLLLKIMRWYRKFFFANICQLYVQMYVAGAKHKQMRNKVLSTLTQPSYCSCSKSVLTEHLHLAITQPFITFINLLHDNKKCWALDYAPISAFSNSSAVNNWLIAWKKNPSLHRIEAECFCFALNFTRPIFKCTEFKLAFSGNSWKPEHGEARF